MKSKHLLMAALVLTVASFAVKADAQVVNGVYSKTSSSAQVTLTATIPTLVKVDVKQADSLLSHEVAYSDIDAATNEVHEDFKIFGDVLVNKASASVQCQLSALSLDLANGTDKITTNFTGTIGGTAVSTSNFAPTFSAKKAAIVIKGDVDETTITSADEPGSYTGVLTITATLP